MSDVDDIVRDRSQLLDEGFQRLQEGNLPGDGTWADWIQRASSLCERFDSAGHPEAADDLRKLLESLALPKT